MLQTMTGMSTIVWWIAAALALSAPAAPAADAGVNELLDQMQQAVWPGKDMRAQFEIKVVSNLGEHAFISGSYYRMRLDDDTTLQRFLVESPLELRDFEIAGETRDGVPKDLHVYVPVVRRVRHLNLDMRKESFLGTDFNFEDLGFDNLHAAQNTLKGEVERDGKTVYEVESIPKDDWMYEKVMRYVDPQTHLPLAAEYYCWGVGLCKMRRIERVDRIGSYVSPAVIVMEDLINKQRTVLTIKNAEFDVGLERSLFLCHSHAGPADCQ